MLASGIGSAGPFKGCGEALPAEWILPALDPSSGPASFDVRVPGFEAIAQGDGYVLRIPDQAKQPQSGVPDVPVLARVVPLASDVSLRIAITTAAFEEIEGIAVVPTATWSIDDPEAAHPAPVESRVASATAYASTNFWPGELLQVQEVWMGTQKFARIEIRPVQYRPSSKTIRLYRQLKGGMVLESNGK
jgi:hypothetical protein